MDKPVMTRPVAVGFANQETRLIVFACDPGVVKEAKEVFADYGDVRELDGNMRITVNPRFPFDEVKKYIDSYIPNTAPAKTNDPADIDYLIEAMDELVLAFEGALSGEYELMEIAKAKFEYARSKVSFAPLVDEQEPTPESQQSSPSLPPSPESDTPLPLMT
jgi:hypothetical protein